MALKVGMVIFSISFYLCTVHGDWTSWSSWGACSATCDLGQQRRERTCSNPYPALNGHYCLGDASDDRICIMPGCADGGWSIWQTWGSCSRTCGDGIHTRSRTCDNPLPSLTGRNCVGDSTQTVMCNMRNCPDGGWSSWQTWGSCSLTCGNGIHTRSRTCNNPSPSLTGKYCVGDSLQATTCNTRTCPEKTSAFTVTNPHGTDSVIIFTTSVFNQGNDYSTSTGRFTCEYPGLYFFTTSLTKARTSGRTYDSISCYITKNDLSLVRAAIDPTDDDTDKGSAEATASVTINLVAGDYVTVGLCFNYGPEALESYSIFSGFLINPD